MSFWDQLVVGPTHACGGTLDLMITNVVAPIGKSDHSSLSAIISMTLAVPNICGNRTVFLKHLVNWNTVCGAIQYLLWHNIRLLPVEVLKEHLSLMFRHYAPTKIIRVHTKISLGR